MFTFALLLAVASPGDAMVLGAEGLDLLARGEVQAALQKLEAAHSMDPSSALIARDFATALARDGQTARALAMIDRALALGDGDPEVQELLAMILADLGRTPEAIEAARRAGTWQGTLIAASLGDREAASDATEHAREPSPRGALTALVLAAYTGESGERTSARNLASVAEVVAADVGSLSVREAARALQGRLEGGQSELFRAAVLLRSAIEHATNPAFSPLDEQENALRLALGVEGAVQAPIGTARLDGAARVDQFVYLEERALYGGRLDVTGFTVAASAEVPISTSPSAALVGVAIRLSDIWADAFRIHYATTIEGGPTLTIPFDLGTKLVLGVFGVGSDFIDRSPSDELVSSQNRDRIGQRAMAALVFDGDVIDARAEALFIRDDAYGEAFDVRGGSIAGRVSAQLFPRLIARGGLALTLRRFGPVGDPAVLGAAATRSEFRTAVEAGLSYRVDDRWSLSVDESWIASAARLDHAYSSNLLSFGVEVVW